MTNTLQRVLIGAAMVLVAGLAALLQKYGVPAVRWLATIVAVAMVAEYALAIWRNRASARQHALACVLFGLLLLVMVCAAWHVGARPWIMLLMLMTICGADIGAWLFGRMIGGDKMWPNLSANKTWAGQIAGIVCGTFMCVMYGLIGADSFLPQLMWIGMGLSLLSQYGDLTASWVKRQLGLKDFSNVLPGHGGVIDRFDGWVYAIVLMWLVLI